MAVGSPNPDLAKDVRTLFSVGVVANLSDGQLLERFAAGRDAADATAEVAFAEIVRRHGPMVHRVCRSILNESHDTQDAVQATFLVLVRKAGAIRNRDSIAGWLHGTALRVARRARSDAARRRVREQRGAVSAEIRSEDPHEGWAELHEELARLPEKYRVPLVLCYLEGMTTEVAARQLGCPQGTILCRLSRGRERLRGRLIRRGLTASAALVSLERVPEVSAAMSSGLLTATVKAALEFAAGGSASTVSGLVSARGLVLAEGTLRSMLMMKLKLLGVTILLGAAIVASAPASLLVRPQVGAPQSTVPSARPAAKPAKKVDDRWVKTLPNGAVVELVGISTHPSGPKTWWSPAGQFLSEPPAVLGDSHTVDPEVGTREFAIRVLGSSAKDDDLQILWKIAPSSFSNAGWIDYKNRAGRTVPNLRMFTATFPVDLKSSGVRLGFATGPWRTEATCTPDGKSTLRGQSPVIFGSIHESRRKANLAVAHKMLDWIVPEALDSMVRVVAVDQTGRTLSAEESGANRSNGIIVRTFKYDGTIKAIKEFQFQTRPYEWVEFQDIPLKPRVIGDIPPERKR